MGHHSYLISNTRQSGDLRAKYRYVRHKWLAERPHTATVAARRQALPLATRPTEALQSLPLGRQRFLAVLELVLCELLRIGMKLASAWARLGVQHEPWRLSRSLSAAKQRQVPKDSQELGTRGFRCAFCMCHGGWRARRGRSELEDRPGWAEPYGGRSSLAKLACGSTGPSSDIHRPIRPRRRVSARETARTSSVPLGPGQSVLSLTRPHQEQLFWTAIGTDHGQAARIRPRSRPRVYRVSSHLRGAGRDHFCNATAPSSGTIRKDMT